MSVDFLTNNKYASKSLTELDAFLKGFDYLFLPPIVSARRFVTFLFYLPFSLALAVNHWRSVLNPGVTAPSSITTECRLPSVSTVSL